jgi:N-formylglutamate amidohydrolase
VLLVILHIPHSSTRIPTQYRPLFTLDGDALNRELLLMTDHFTDDIFTAQPGDTTVVAPVSRLLVDVERYEDDEAEPMAAKGMGVIYERTSSGAPLKQVTASQRRELLETYYEPHHDLLAAAAKREIRSRGLAMIVDCHSFPTRPLPFEDAALPRPDICLGSDPHHTPARLLDRLTDALADLELSWAENTPFGGTMVPAPFQDSSQVCSIMIEVNRSLYMDEASGEKIDTYVETKETVNQLLAIVRSYQNAQAKLGVS